MSTLVRPLPILRASIDDVRLDVFVELPDDHGLREGDEVELLVEDPAFEPPLRFVARIASIGQNGAGRLVGLSPMVVRLRDLEPRDR